jgi:siroheme synthase-like protein
MSGLYPAMLRLAGRRCVVVGGGNVAARKVARLVEAGADVTVVAPDQGPELTKLAERGLLQRRRRSYRRGDLAGACLAFAATDSRAVNAAVADEAASLNVPVNVADNPAVSTFQVPAVIERDGLTLTVSTGGRSPAFARRLREQLEALLSTDRLALLDLYAELRDFFASEGDHLDGPAWAAADDQALELIRRGRVAEARDILRQQVLASAAARSRA